jgi:hypothetical protein
METPVEKKLRIKIRLLIIFFMVALILSGITAFPVETELAFLNDHISWFPVFMQNWIAGAYHAIATTNHDYPFLSYGTDWLAFAHIVIAIAFIGPLRDPVKNIWVVQFGMIACVLVIPLALIAGPMRGIPFYWRMIDCSFGVIGIIPLWFCYMYIRWLRDLTAGD